MQMKRYYVCILVLMAVEAIVNLSGIGVQKLIIDNVFVQGMYGQLPVVIGLYAAVFLLDAVLFTGIRTVMFSHKAKIRQQLISDYMNRFYRIPFKLYRNGRNADNVQLLTKDVDGMSVLLGQRLPEGAQTIIKMILLVGTVGLASPYLLLIVAAVSPIYIILTKYYGTKLKQVAKHKSEGRSAMLVHLEEGIAAAREIAAFNRQEREMQRYHHLFRSYYEKAALETSLTNKQVVWSGPLKWGVNLIVLAYLGHGVLHHTISLGTFVVVYQFASRLIDSISESYGFAVGLSGSFASVERYREFSSFEPIEPGNYKLMEAIRSVELESVTFRYGDEGRPVLRELSLSLPIGKKIAFIGASGSGKSTIAQLLVRLCEPTGGRLLVNGLPIEQLDREQWAGRTNIVFQEPYLFPDTIRNNLTFGRSVTDQALTEMCRNMNMQDVISSLPQGYDTPVGERGVNLSGGQRQRLAIIRSLLADPDILLLDEATSALDAETERQVQRYIDEVRRGKTTIVIAHRLSTVENADMIYVLDQGRIAEQGTYEELAGNGPIFGRLLNASFA